MQNCCSTNFIDIITRDFNKFGCSFQDFHFSIRAGISLRPQLLLLRWTAEKHRQVAPRVLADCGLTKSFGPKLSFLVNLNPGKRQQRHTADKRRGNEGFGANPRLLLAAKRNHQMGVKKDSFYFSLSHASSIISVLFIEVDLVGCNNNDEPLG